MAENITNLSDSQKADLDRIRQQFARKTAEIGQTEITLSLMKEQKEKLMKEYQELRDSESKFLSELESSYGKGYLDVENKTYHTV